MAMNYLMLKNTIQAAFHTNMGKLCIGIICITLIGITFETVLVLNAFKRISFLDRQKKEVSVQLEKQQELQSVLGEINNQAVALFFSTVQFKRTFSQEGEYANPPPEKKDISPSLTAYEKARTEVQRLLRYPSFFPSAIQNNVQRMLVASDELIAHEEHCLLKKGKECELIADKLEKLFLVFSDIQSQLLQQGKKVQEVFSRYDKEGQAYRQSVIFQRKISFFFILFLVLGAGFFYLYEIGKEEKMRRHFQIKNQKLEVLYGVNNILLKYANPREIVKETLRLLLEAFQLPACYAYFQNARTKKITSLGISDDEEQEQAAGAKRFVSHAEKLFEDISSTPHALSIISLPSDDFLSIQGRKLLISFALPINTEEYCIVLLPVESEDVRDEMAMMVSTVRHQMEEHFKRELSELQLLHAHDNLSAAHVELQEVMEELEKTNNRLQDLAIKDPLTGLFNRRFFTEFLEKEFHGLSRYGEEALSLILCDIDFFKKINDTYGHPCGDYVLIVISDMILKEERASDFSVRYGGEEFALILPKTTTEGATLKAERLREQVEAFPFNYEGQKFRVTMSFGLTSYRPGLGPNEMVAEADAALYRAKGKDSSEGGRNRVVVADIKKSDEEKKGSS